MAITAQKLHEEWYKISLIRGIPLTYKGKDLIFNTVYMRESTMQDQEVFSQVSGENIEQSNEMSKKLFTLVTRVIAGEGYSWEDREAIEKIGKADRKIKPLERKFDLAETDEEREEIEGKIKELRKGLIYPNQSNMADETVLLFTTDCFKDEKTRPVDFVRLAKVFQEINLLQEESLDSFLMLPGI
jgi:hypothetical protein